MIRVGPAGWSYADWEGPIHPRPRPKAYHGLELLASVFGCLEINSSFYRLPNPESCIRWLELTQNLPHFRFTAKLQQDFTHQREQRFATPRALEAGLSAYRSALQPLLASPQFGALLIQFPFTFAPNPRNLRYLTTLVQATADLRPVLELRQRSWYQASNLRAIEATGASLCALDLPFSADHQSADFTGLGPIGYLRLHGRNSAAWFDPQAGRDQRYDYAYSAPELAAVAERVQRSAKQRGPTYVITNNHFGGQAVAAGVQLLALLGQAPGDLPAHWREHFPELAKIAPPRHTGGLF